MKFHTQLEKPFFYCFAELLIFSAWEVTFGFNCNSKAMGSESKRRRTVSVYTAA